MRVANGLLALALCGLCACNGPDKTVNDTGQGSGSGGEGGGDDGGPGSGTGVEDCMDQTPVVEVGTGDDSFQSLEEGAGVVMVHGPQGGWHMLGSVRMTAMTSIVEVHFTITHDASGEVIADNLYRVMTVYDEASCTGVYPGMYGYLDDSALEDGDKDTPPETLGYADVTMCMVVTDEELSTAEGCVGIVAIPDPVDLEDE